MSDSYAASLRLAIQRAVPGGVITVKDASYVNLAKQIIAELGKDVSVAVAR